MEIPDKNYNYFKFSEGQEVIGVGAAEKGSTNELFIIDECIRLGLKLEKITKEEYEEFEGDEIKNH